ncbi:MAG TPA: haloacid dehalogenase type II [Roseiarcus sp.]|nr:haloacid dehalogenase type II [Roseiarcus sp.]
MAGAGFAAASYLDRSIATAATQPRFKAVAFDAFPIFDPRPVATLCEELFPSKGAELVNLWRVRQFEYTWLRTVSNRYADFMQVTGESLSFAVRALKLELTADKRDRLLGAHFELKTWPDVVPALSKLKDSGLRFSFLSNFTSGMLDGCIKTSGLDGMFEEVVSTDRAKTYKPDARAYRLGVDALGLPREEILFVAFAGWDAAGAKTFGYPTYWVNRLGLPPEELGVLPDGVGVNLTDLLTFLS